MREQVELTASRMPHELLAGLLATLLVWLVEQEEQQLFQLLEQLRQIGGLEQSQATLPFHLRP
jgi:hypothetical protein